MNLKCTYNIPTLPFDFDVETKEILKQLSKSRICNMHKKWQKFVHINNNMHKK